MKYTITYTTKGWDTALTITVNDNLLHDTLHHLITKGRIIVDVSKVTNVR